MKLEFFNKSYELMQILEQEESENIAKAAELVANSIMNGGITQAFGSGHSFAAAIEVSGRAGGLIPSKVINDPAMGIYERSIGVGDILMNRVMIEPNDVFFLISNSGRNPMIIEIAERIKEKGNPIIVVTALESSKKSESRHPNGKLLYQYADVVLDNHSEFGDAALNIEGLDTKVCGTSSIAATLLLQQTIYEAIRIMVEKGYNPPVFKSANIDGGIEFNLKYENEFAHRIFHV
ncbi:SIS domain-containing protein [Helcococcus kunzii]|uniref:SIS domain-containing protein n=1 Tax=Helcococcus kunzii TaxID=40091 RepID=UPI00389B7AA7